MKLSYVFPVIALGILQGCGNGDDGFPTDPAGGNHAPEAQNLEIHSALADLFIPGLPVILSGNYYDAEGDEGDTHLFTWLRNGNKISGADSYKYTLTKADANVTISACVTPRAKTGVREGQQACTEIEVVSEIDLTDAPTAVVTIDDTTVPFVGEEIRSSYSYSSPVSANEGQSLFLWVELTDNFPTVQQCATGANQDCILPVPDALNGKVIESCVIPVDENNLPGPLVCDKTLGGGIALTGELQYRKDLKADVFGLPSGSTFHWKMDLSNDDGPQGNLTYADQSTGAVDGALFTTQFNVGSIEALKDEQYYMDVNGNGIVDDHDWQYAGDLAIPAAREYIGKDVQFCVDMPAGYTPAQKCQLASETQASDGTLCSDATACVVGGVYYDSQVGITARGVEPTRAVTIEEPHDVVEIAAPTTFHRPISMAEYEMRDVLALGNLPEPDSTTMQTGIDWVMYRNGVPSNMAGSSKALDFCSNLTSADADNWSLPVTSDSFNTDSHAGSNGGNAAPTGLGQNLDTFADAVISGGASRDGVSFTWGWPVDNQYNSATAAKSGTHRPVSLNTGAAQGYVSDSAVLMTTCAK
ncbi:hypothetical protein ACQEXU_08675 [Vibrio sp. TRT 21S02]|uniref:hypothetical protein n=1 Tax=Vibrio sp. TRT 21S02 TaxID=3418507 RepID=UPI003CF89AB9